MGKKDKKSKEAKKARSLEKQQKAQAKSENKEKKMAKKVGEDDDDMGIDEILASYAKQQEEFEAVTISTCNRPSKRTNAAMVANPVHGKKELFIFGGESTTSAGLAVFYNDLFQYSIESDQWRKISSPNTPLPRSGHSMCVHPSGIILLFGGEFSSPKQSTFYHYGDTWILDAHSKEWTKVENKKGPTARSGHRMTYWKNYILLHGGFRDLSASTTYLSDLWAFDVTSYKWHQIEWPTSHMAPDARSGHSMVPTGEGAIIWGGYSKVKAGKGLQKGKVHTDSWLLKMKSDLKGVRWERRKKSGFAPSPRVGCSMVHHKGRGVLFGGVYDTDETEESLDSIFYNTLFAYQIEMNRWFALSLRAPKKKKVQVSSSKPEDRHAELEATLSQLLSDKLKPEEDEEVDALSKTPSSESSKQNSDDEDAHPAKEYPVVASMPHPRFNSTTAVVDDTLFIFGGVYEHGEREYNLDSMYSLDLGKLDGLKVYWEDLRELEEGGSDEEDDDDEDDEEGDEDEDDEEDGHGDDDDEQEEEEEEEEEEPEPEGIPDPRPWLPHPKPFESLRDFYIRTSAQFIDWALTNNKDARGKDLKKVAFDLAEDRWWERREEVRVAEDKYEEMGGVGEVIERDASSRTGKGRR
ncbi:Kel3p [Sugiyamaella lignohabitans]|uniref:Kel3p n=1 Tax=Sugiyamaella lignohabitans TaxID=796027 RepID=A0A167FDF4_9ASCO|nr:Kel3p [Sugiyamaella lignohabitans]ANB15158.1 Kel3p [Sugiyamaella lignohabitans]